MDIASGVAIALAAAGVYAGTYGEFDYNAGPSVFPPVEGPMSLPDRAQGYYQARGDEFIRQLAPAEKVIWDGLDPAQQKRAALFIRNGGTLISSIGSDF